MIKLGFTIPDAHVRAHRHCRNNREELSRSDVCGCFYCLAIYSPIEITEWVREEQTAICPRCGIDSVIAKASGYPNSAEFLQKMHDRWF